MNSFPESLKEARLRAGLSQPELAEKVGVDKSYISKLERGVESPPSRKVTLRLMDVLGISALEERNKFLISAGVFNKEDYEGYTLVKVVQPAQTAVLQATQAALPSPRRRGLRFGAGFPVADEHIARSAEQYKVKLRDLLREVEEISRRIEEIGNTLKQLLQAGEELE